VAVFGERFRFHFPAAPSPVSEVFARQVLAFGPSLMTQLKALRVGIIGAGGTGSATAMLAARAGAGQIVVVDDDIVEPTNLNRLHGATQSDADAMMGKADIAAREIARMGLGVRVVPLKGWANAPHVRDALKSCDVFGKRFKFFMIEQIHILFANFSEVISAFDFHWFSFDPFAVFPISSELPPNSRTVTASGMSSEAP